MIVDVKVPEVGESITEGVLVSWSVDDGAAVKAGDALFELETDKITLNVEAKEAGRIEILVEEGAKVEVGQVVAKIDTSKAASAGQLASQSERASRDPGRERDRTAGEREAPEPEAKEEPGRAVTPRPNDLSPAVRRLVEEHDLDPRRIPGSGRDGRITKEDVLRFLDEPARPAPQAQKQAAEPAPRSAPVTPLPDRRQTREPMSSLRQRIAQRLVEAQQSAAILTTFNEVDMTEVLAWRARHREAFEKRHGVRLGFMSFFVKAAVDALKLVPSINAQIEGDSVVQNHFYDIGVAVGTDRGLVVPVLRDADRLGFAEIELGIADLARRAQARKLELSELSGGTFTISNGGVYGSLLSTPILNPPQSGILGLHGIKKRPVVVGEDDRIEARPMMYLALSYDHRLVDGKEAVTFLRRVVECIEHPERVMLEV